MNTPAAYRRPSSSERWPTSRRLTGALVLALSLFLVGAPRADSADLEIDQARIVVAKDKGANEPTTRIHVGGKANLPDGTVIWVHLIYRPYKLKFMRERAFVKGGRFKVVMGPYDRPLFPDRYDIGVTFYPNRQPRAVRPKLVGRTPLKAQITTGYQLERMAAMRKKLVAETGATIGILDRLSRSMSTKIVALRKLEQAKKLPKGKALKPWRKWGGLWDLDYERVRKTNDERRDTFYLVPFVKTDKALIRVINYLMDFQYEYRNLLDKDEGFRLSRKVGTLSMLVFQAQGLFRYEKILLSAEPAKDLQEEILRLGKIWGPAAARPLPTSDQVRAALAGQARFARDSRRMALYQLLSDREQRRTKLRTFFALKAQARGAEIRFSNTWLLELRNAEWVFRQERSRSFSGLPGLDALSHRLQLLNLLELARQLTARGLIKPLPPAAVSKTLMPAAAQLFDDILERYGLKQIHAQSLRHQAHRLSKMSADLASKAKQASGQAQFDGHQWEQWSQIFDTQLLRLSIFELRTLGTIKLSPKQQTLFDDRQLELQFKATRLMKLKGDMDLALAKKTRKSAIAPVIDQLAGLGREAHAFAEKIK